MLDGGRTLVISVSPRGEATCLGFERRRQLKCVMAIFRAAFYFEEKSRSIKIHKDSEKIVSPFFMNGL